MGILQSLFGRKPEQRQSPGGRAIGGGLIGRGGQVPVHLAETLSAVLGCVELIAGAISSLPASIMQDGDEAPRSSAAWRILDRPNPWQSWPTFVSWLVASILLHGNG